MKKFIAFAFAAAIALMPITSAFAQDASDLKITVAADSSTGTYKKMLGEIVNACSNDGFDINMAADVHGGAPGNLDALLNNKAQAAFLHSDVFEVMKNADPKYQKLKTLVALYPEQIHVLALRDTKIHGTGTLDRFKTPVFNSLSEITNLPVGAAGGGAYSIRILKGSGDAQFTTREYDDGDALIKGLNDGEIAAAIFVGAAPLDKLTKLPKGVYKLLPIGEPLASKVKGIYREESLNYPGLTQGPIKTMAPTAVILTRSYATEGKVNAQRHFRSCFLQHLDQLKDEGSPNWQQVESDDHGPLNNWLELPAATKTAVVTPSKK